MISFIIGKFDPTDARTDRHAKMSSRSSNNDGGDGNFTETEFLFVVARLLPLPQSVLGPPWFNLFSAISIHYRVFESFEDNAALTGQTAQSHNLLLIWLKNPMHPRALFIWNQLAPSLSRAQTRLAFP